MTKAALPDTPPRKRKPTQRFKQTPLTEADWVETATGILVDENVRGITIDALCGRLGVTKGSFYWHFKGRTELLAALLANWRRRMTTNIIDRLGQQDGDATQRLTALFELTRRPKSANFARVEESVRDWARRADLAKDAVGEVDQTRLAYFRELLQAHGLDPETAERRAYIAYAIMMGDSVLQASLDPGDPADPLIAEIVAMLTRAPDGPDP